MAPKKAQKKESTAPVLDIPVAKVKIRHAELFEEPQEITTEGGNTFTVDPNFNCLIEVVDDFMDSTHDGVTFYESFKLKQNESGEWELRDGTKFGALAKARYGRDFFDSDQEFNVEDFDEFEFQAKVMPKENFRTKEVIGSTLHYETIMAVPKPKKKGEKTVEQAAAEQANDEDFSEIPF